MMGCQGMEENPFHRRVLYSGSVGDELCPISDFRDGEFEGCRLALALVRAASVDVDDDRETWVKSWRR